MRYKKIEEGKIRYFKSVICKQPYNSFYDEFYKEYNCGWLGKESSTSRENTDYGQDNEVEEYHKIGANTKRLSMANEFNPDRVLRDIQGTTVLNPNEEDEDYDLPF